MGKKLDGLDWKSAWVTHVGCVQGCLEYLGQTPSRAWLAGGTGHAFALNLERNVVCPSGPTAWGYGAKLTEVAPNLGFRLAGDFGFRRDADFDAKQEEAWVFVRDAIDRGIPCYGWELGIPEYYVLTGYDDTGYFYAGCDTGGEAGPKSWRDLGRTDIGLLEYRSVELCPPAPDVKAVKDALALALTLAEGGAACYGDAYVSGPEGFRVWADTLERGAADPFGNAYNIAVWDECRGDAVGFLREAKAKLPGSADGLFDDAIGYYTRVHEHLHALADLFPYPPRDAATDPEKNRQGAIHLRSAAEAEHQGLATLDRLHQAL